MTTAEEIREEFEIGSFREAMEKLDATEAVDSTMVHLFLSYRPPMYREMSIWAQRVLRHNQMFLPDDLFFSQFSDLLDLIERFSTRHHAAIQTAYWTHSNYFEKPPFADVAIREAREVWRQDSASRVALGLPPRNKLFGIENEVIEMTKMAIQWRGEALSSYPHSQLLSACRIWLATDKVLQEDMHDMLQGI